MPDLPVGTRQRPLTPSELEAIVTQAYQTPIPRRPIMGRVADTVRSIFSGWFSPGEPLTTVAPADTQPRQFAFPLQVNRAMQPRATEPVSFFELRVLAEHCTLVRLAIETCKDEEERFSWDLAPKPGSTRKDNDGLMNEIRAFLDKPDGVTPFVSWMRPLREDQLAIDAPCVYLQRTKGGQPYAISPVDGAVIKPLVDVTGRTPRVGPAYEQVIFGIKTGEFDRREMVYLPRNRRTHRIYGFPVVEQLMITGNGLINREVSRLLYYVEGNTPDVFLKAPKEWTPDQLAQAQAWWAQYKGDLSSRRGIMVVPESGIQEMHEPPLKTEIDEWWAREIMFAFSLSPMPFIKQGLNRASAQQVAETALDQGLIPRQMFWSRFFGLVIEAMWGVTDIELTWQQVRDPDPKVQSEVAEIDFRNGFRTINEIRDEKGLGHLEGGDDAMLLTASGPVLLKDIAAGKYTPLDPQEKAKIAAAIGTNGDANRGAPAGDEPQNNVGDAAGGSAGSDQVPTDGTAPALAANDKEKKKLAKAVRTIDTVPKRHRNFWLAARATPPPRARPSGDWRGM